jgi:hypothetical protein
MEARLIPFHARAAVDPQKFCAPKEAVIGKMSDFTDIIHCDAKQECLRVEKACVFRTVNLLFK